MLWCHKAIILRGAASSWTKEGTLVKHTPVYELAITLSLSLRPEPLSPTQKLFTSRRFTEITYFDSKRLVRRNVNEYIGAVTIVFSYPCHCMMRQMVKLPRSFLHWKQVWSCSPHLLGFLYPIKINIMSISCNHDISSGKYTRVCTLSGLFIW